VKSKYEVRSANGEVERAQGHGVPKNDERRTKDDVRRGSGLKVLWSVVRVVAALGLVALLLLRMDLRKSLALVRAANPWFVLVAALLMLLLFALCNTRWQVLLRARDRRYSWPFLFRVYLASNALNAILPTSLGGDVLRIFWTSAPGGAPGAVSVVLVDRALGLLGLLVLSLSASLVLLFRSGWNALYLLNIIGLAGVAVVVAATFVDPLYRVLAGLLRRIRVLGMGEKILGVLDGVRAFSRPARVILLAFGLSVAVWLVHCSFWFALGAAIGCKTPLIYYFVYVPLVALATMIPISIGGAGVRENGFVLLMTRAGMPADQAGTIALLLLFLVYFFALVGGVLLIGLRRSRPEPGSAGRG
jgi:uncharacterized protein (TIRG00374 family)